MIHSNLDPASARLRRHLREMRLQAGLTQAALGERLNRTQQWVYKYETGERRLDVIEFIQIARAIGFDPGKFINSFMLEPAEIDAARSCNIPRPESASKTRT